MAKHSMTCNTYADFSEELARILAIVKNDTCHLQELGISLTTKEGDVYTARLVSPSVKKETKEESVPKTTCKKEEHVCSCAAPHDETKYKTYVKVSTVYDKPRNLEEFVKARYERMYAQEPTVKNDTCTCKRMCKQCVFKEINDRRRNLRKHREQNFS